MSDNMALRDVADKLVAAVGRMTAAFEEGSAEVTAAIRQGCAPPERFKLHALLEQSRKALDQLLSEPQPTNFKAEAEAAIAAIDVVLGPMENPIR